MLVLVYLQFAKLEALVEQTPGLQHIIRQAGNKRIHVKKKNGCQCLSSELFTFKPPASVCSGGCALMCLLNKHSLLKVSLIRLMQCVSVEAVATGMWMFFLCGTLLVDLTAQALFVQPCSLSDGHCLQTSHK